MKITYKAILLGILSSLFFASTFLVNRAMNLSGSHPLWNGCLRYFWTLPLYALLLVRKHEMKAVITEIEKNTKEWILWSTVGFGIFYFCITMSSVYGAAWLIDRKSVV